MSKISDPFILISHAKHVPRSSCYKGSVLSKGDTDLVPLRMEPPLLLVSCGTTLHAKFIQKKKKKWLDVVHQIEG